MVRGFHGGPATGPILYRPNIEAYDWIKEADPQIRIASVELPDGTGFYYGSLVGLHKGVKSIASKVTPPDSESLQKALFMALPDLLISSRAAGVLKVENTKPNAPTLLAVSRNIIRAPSMLVTIESPEDLDSQLVLKTGISNSNDHERLKGIMGIVQSGGRRRNR